MKQIGLIGGMTWESSKVYYDFSNRMVKEFLGASHSCKTIMTSVDFAEIEKLTKEDNWVEIGDMMAECAKQLEAAGADIILLCTNTIHLVSHRIMEAVDIPFLHIAEPTGQAIKAKNLSKVALIGTRFTMEKDFYTKLLEEKFGLEVIIPPAEERQVLHDIIYQELGRSQFLDSSKEKCIQIIKKLEQAGAEGVIMGCTELPLLVKDDDIDIPAFDTGKLHIRQAVEWAVQESQIKLAN